MKESDISKIIKRVINENENQKKVISVVMDLYDVSTSHFVVRTSLKFNNKNTVKTIVTFTPKDYDNPLTLKIAKSTALWRRKNDGSYTFYDCDYIRHSEMPVLKYINGTYWMDKYVESLHEEMIHNFIEENN